MNDQKPFFTIISSTFNAERDLPWTIESIRSQTFKNIQWIIIDGNSSDKTTELIKQNQDVVSFWLSEPDTGIYDAWNKALSHIRGSWVQFLGAGDAYSSPDTLRRVASELETLPSQFNVAYGKTELIHPNSRKTLTVIGREWGEMKNCWDGIRPELPSHPSCFHRALLFDTYKFNAGHKIAADSHLLLWCLKQNDPYYLPFLVDRMPTGGASGTIKGSIRFTHELREICGDLGIRIPWGIYLRARLFGGVKLLGLAFFSESRLGMAIDLFRRLTGKPPIWTSK